MVPFSKGFKTPFQEFPDWRPGAIRCARFRICCTTNGFQVSSCCSTGFQMRNTSVSPCFGIPHHLHERIKAHSLPSNPFPRSLGGGGVSHPQIALPLTKSLQGSISPFFPSSRGSGDPGWPKLDGGKNTEAFSKAGCDVLGSMHPTWMLTGCGKVT